MKCSVFSQCPEIAVVIDEIGLTSCLGHALSTVCECGTRRAFCGISGCGRWHPVGPKAGALLMYIFEHVFEVED